MEVEIKTLCQHLKRRDWLDVPQAWLGTSYWLKRMKGKVLP